MRTHQHHDPTTDSQTLISTINWNEILTLVAAPIDRLYAVGRVTSKGAFEKVALDLDRKIINRLQEAHAQDPQDTYVLVNLSDTGPIEIGYINPHTGWARGIDDPGLQLLIHTQRWTKDGPNSGLDNQPKLYR